MATGGMQPERLTPVRRRVALAKVGFALAGAAAFGAAFAFSRAYHPATPKQPPHLEPLAASPEYHAAVRKLLGDAGVVRGPLASPDAATHLS